MTTNNTPARPGAVTEAKPVAWAPRDDAEREAVKSLCQHCYWQGHTDGKFGQTDFGVVEAVVPHPPAAASPAEDGPFPPARRRRVVQIAIVPPLEAVHPGATMLLCDDGSVWSSAHSANASWYRDDLSAVEFGE